MQSLIEADLKTAMKAGDKRRVATLRLLLSVLKNEKIQAQRDLTPEEVEAALKDVIREKGLSSSKDVGLAMKELMARHKGRVDGKQAQEIARRLLP